VELKGRISEPTCHRRDWKGGAKIGKDCVQKYESSETGEMRKGLKRISQGKEEGHPTGW